MSQRYQDVVGPLQAAYDRGAEMRDGMTKEPWKLAERDALIAKREERVRVLERIATDDSARLRDEIDRLRDTP